MTNRYSRWPDIQPQPSPSRAQLQLLELAGDLPSAQQVWLAVQLCSRRVGFYSTVLYWQQLDQRPWMQTLRHFWTTKGCAW